LGKTPHHKKSQKKKMLVKLKEDARPKGILVAKGRSSLFLDKENDSVGPGQWKFVAPSTRHGEKKSGKLSPLERILPRGGRFSKSMH